MLAGVGERGAKVCTIAAQGGLAEGKELGK